MAGLPRRCQGRRQLAARQIAKLFANERRLWLAMSDNTTLKELRRNFVAALAVLAVILLGAALIEAIR
jgi:hypothetical protein